MSSSGKSVIIATTGGNVAVPGWEAVKVGLNVYRPQQAGRTLGREAGMDDGWAALYLREYSDRQSRAHESAQQARDMRLAEALTRLQARGEQISLRKLAREAKMAPYPSVQTFLKQQQLPSSSLAQC